MLNLILAGTTSFLLTFLAIPAIMRVADEKELFDLPDGRKLHSRPIASLGGVGIFIGFTLCLLLFISNKLNPEFQYFIAAALITFFLGVKDDILVLSATKKFIGQLIAAAIIIHLGNVQIDSMHGFLGVHQIPVVWSLLLTYLTVIVVINAFNLIDGVDGLAASLGILTTSIFGLYFYIAHMPAYAILAFAMTGSLSGFLIFNYNPAKIFMGDSGSLLIGLVNAILVIKFITVADITAGSFPIESSVAIGFSILIVPLLDTLRVFAIRIFKGKSPFSPDRNHIHHLLLDRGLNHRHVTLICVVVNVLFIGISYFGRSLGSTVLLSAILPTCFIFIAMLKYLRRSANTLVISTSFQHNNDSSLQSTTKVVSLKAEVAAAEQ
jgi:UDP-GlcNAc:undecaprenyl-phosphate/decaprenyl-phosphate GlcNAc-1-phosphate transferase